MKKNKLYFIYLFSLLSFLPFLGIGQQTISSILVPNRCEPSSNLDALLLLNLPSDQIDSIFYNAKSNVLHRGSTISALGFILSNNDSEAVSFVDSIATAHEQLSGVASEAIFRIGGVVMDNYLSHVFSKDDFSYQVEVIQFTWVIDNKEDLAILEKHLVRVNKDHPDWKINKFINVTFRKQLDFAIWIHQEKNQQEIFDKLVNILDFNVRPFVSQSAHKATIWAIKMLNKAAIDKEKLYTYMVNRKNQLVNSPLKEAFLFHLHQLGYELNDSESAWLKEANHLLLGQHFQVFRSKEEIEKYYAFRAKYPYSHSNHSH